MRGAPAGAETGVAAEQRHREPGQRRRQPVHERRVPRRIAERIAEQHAFRSGALGGEIGEVHRHQLPRDIGRRIGGQIVDALDDHVMRQHQIAEHRRIVHQPTRGGMGGEATETGDEIGFGHGLPL